MIERAHHLLLSTSSALKTHWRKLWPLALLLLVAAVTSWVRGSQPERQAPTPAQTATAGQLLAVTQAQLSGRAAEGPRLEGDWYVTVYPEGGSEPRTVRAEGAASRWAEPLRDAWPGTIQVDVALPDPPGERSWLLALGIDWSVDVGIDGWIEDGGRLHLPVSFVLRGYDRAALARFIAEHPGRPLRTYAWVDGGDGPRRMLRHSVDPGPITAPLLRQRLALASGYLQRHLRADGRFDYQWDVRRAEPTEGYDLLRHAGTTYSLLQLSRLGSGELERRAAMRALGPLRQHTRSAVEQPTRCYVEDGDQVPLGASALTLLALSEQAAARPDDADLGWMRCLAEHLVAETAASGQMRSFYAEPGRHRANASRSIYYPGEAVLALVRLHQVDPQARWHDTALRAARYLIHQRWYALGVRSRVAPDCWLIQALEELHRSEPAADLAAYAWAIAGVLAREQLVGANAPADLLGSPFDLELPNVVAAGARLEGLLAAARLERRLRPGDDHYRRRLLLAAGFSLRNQYAAPIVFGLPQPDSYRGGFRNAENQPLIRIDGVQHNVSGLWGLLMLLEGE